ncbi:hypothetical protein LPJ64_001339 [Coemansia asiatica]|uniref:Non-structural maintenance of chromosomes element 1 homolog n=1 Tax=Coemansia asiatica TaxID=1052880 RepID=A0A9W7XNM8_9FUNG|nr:hypothetical protein LPJ64_001339 [Coemansia asiatica]
MSLSMETKHRMFLQWCMSANLSSETQLRETIQRIFDDQQMDIQEAVDLANSCLSKYSLELRSAIDQTTGTRHWAMVNTNADTIATGATPYIQSELAILKALIEEILTEDTGNYAVSLHDALKTASKTGPTGMARGQAEKLIAEFCKDCWLARSQGGWVVLGTRAIIELQPFFTDGFGDYQRHCALCSEMATEGVVCTECYAVVHPYCARQLALSSSNSTASTGSDQLSCPKCRRLIARPMRFGPGKPGVPHSIEQTQAEPELNSPSEEYNTPRGRKRVLDDSDRDDETEEDIISD